MRAGSRSRRHASKGTATSNGDESVPTSDAEQFATGPPERPETHHEPSQLLERAGDWRWQTNPYDTRLPSAAIDDLRPVNDDPLMKLAWAQFLSR